VVEELGLLGAIGLIVLYAGIVWRGLVIARRAPDMLGTLMATGLVTWIGLEACINMMVMVGLLPFAGNALPFVSAGGSNLVSCMSAVGILLSISRQRGQMPLEEEWRPQRATADLRGGTGGGAYPALAALQALNARHEERRDALGGQRDRNGNGTREARGHPICIHPRGGLARRWPAAPAAQPVHDGSRHRGVPQGTSANFVRTY